MKSMTCKELGGACDMVFQANTFEEIAQMSKAHGTEMFQKGDEAHLAAMKKMRITMHTPEEMKTWFAEKRRQFDDLSED